MKNPCFALGGCGDGDIPLPKIIATADRASAGAATMTLANTSSALAAGTDVVYVSVDGQRLAFLARDKAVTIASSPGAHEVTVMHVDLREKATSHNIEVAAGHSLFKTWVSFASTKLAPLDAVPPYAKPYIQVL